MASSDGKLGGITEGLGMAVTNFEPGRVGQEGIRKFLYCGGTGGCNVLGGDVGADPKDRAGSGELHERGRAQDHWETEAERGGWEMNLSSSEGCYAIGRVRRDTEGHHKEAEYGRAIHCEAPDSGTL